MPPVIHASVPTSRRQAVADRVAEALGQQVVVEPRPARQDGRARRPTGTLLFASASSSTPPWPSTLDLSGQLCADCAARDPAVPSVLVADGPGQRTSAELVTLAKARPAFQLCLLRQLSTAAHLAGELFKSMASIDVRGVVSAEEAKYHTQRGGERRGRDDVLDPRRPPPGRSMVPRCAASRLRLPRCRRWRKRGLASRCWRMAPKGTPPAVMGKLNSHATRPRRRRAAPAARGGLRAGGAQLA